MGDDRGASDAEDMLEEGTEKTLDFGWEDDKPLSGRRAAKERAKRRKVKPGSFGASKWSPGVDAGYLWMLGML